MFGLAEIQSYENKLKDHELYKQINSVPSLKLFMESHIFAVWDFMSLVKTLQRYLTCLDTPWRPAPYRGEIVRFINEIVLSEESDLNEQGKAMSHFSMYLDAMEEVGANTKKIKFFLMNYDLGHLQMAQKNFVSYHLDLCFNGTPVEVAAAFFYGREKLLPEIFTSIVENLETQNLNFPKLKYYLKRHIELDGSEHGHLAQEILSSLIKTDEDRYLAHKAAVTTLKLRSELWTEALSNIRKQRIAQISL